MWNVGVADFELLFGISAYDLQYLGPNFPKCSYAPNILKKAKRTPQIVFMTSLYVNCGFVNCEVP